jgi:hypothetical protein
MSHRQDFEKLTVLLWAFQIVKIHTNKYLEDNSATAVHLNELAKY